MNRRAFHTIAAVLTLIGAAVGADLETKRKITLEASVPFEFVVGNRAFPAGTYTFEMATGKPTIADQSAVLVVRSTERKLYAAIATEITSGGSAPAGHKLVFVRNGDRMFLSKVWRQGNAAGLSVRTVAGATPGPDRQESEVVALNAPAIHGGT